MLPQGPGVFDLLLACTGACSRDASRGADRVIMSAPGNEGVPMNAIRRRAATAIALFTLCTSAAASDEQQLTDLLNEFLAGATRGDVATHERFWADDLIYTSSSGVRTDKARIVEGMRNAGAPATPPAVASWWR